MRGDIDQAKIKALRVLIAQLLKKEGEDPMEDDAELAMGEDPGAEVAEELAEESEDELINVPEEAPADEDDLSGEIAKYMRRSDSAPVKGKTKTVFSLKASMKPKKKAMA